MYYEQLLGSCSSIYYCQKTKFTVAEKIVSERVSRSVQCITTHRHNLIRLTVLRIIHISKNYASLLCGIDLKDQIFYIPALCWLVTTTIILTCVSV